MGITWENACQMPRVVPVYCKVWIWDLEWLSEESTSVEKSSFFGNVSMHFHLGCMEVRLPQVHSSLAAICREIEWQMRVPFLISGHLFYPRDSKDSAWGISPFLSRATHPKPRRQLLRQRTQEGDQSLGEAPCWWSGLCRVWSYLGRDVRLSSLLNFSVRPISEACLVSFSGPWHFCYWYLFLPPSRATYIQWHAFTEITCTPLSPHFSPHTQVSGLGQTLTDEKWHVSSNLTCPISQLTPGEAGRLEWDIVCQSLHLTEGEVGVAGSVFTFPGLAVTLLLPFWLEDWFLTLIKGEEFINVNI